MVQKIGKNKMLVKFWYLVILIFLTVYWVIKLLEPSNVILDAMAALISIYLVIREVIKIFQK